MVLQMCSVSFSQLPRMARWKADICTPATAAAQRTCLQRTIWQATWSTAGWRWQNDDSCACQARLAYACVLAYARTVASHWHEHTFSQGGQQAAQASRKKPRANSTISSAPREAGGAADKGAPKSAEAGRGYISTHPPRTAKGDRVGAEKQPPRSTTGSRGVSPARSPAAR
jgi:hypothetical protein